MKRTIRPNDVPRSLASEALRLAFGGKKSTDVPVLSTASALPDGEQNIAGMPDPLG